MVMNETDKSFSSPCFQYIVGETINKVKLVRRMLDNANF